MSCPLSKLCVLRDRFVCVLECLTPPLTSLALLLLRLVMAWEFFESGREKFRGANWFADIADKFPWPIKLLPVSLNWTMATYAELIGAVLLALGLATRFSAFSLMVITVVAISAVHWPEKWSTLSELFQGYTITDEGHGNFKLPLLYLVMLFVLVAQGGGRWALDRWLAPCLGLKKQSK